MYGEKEEQVSELKLDIMDVKQMYKQQVNMIIISAVLYSESPFTGLP